MRRASARGRGLDLHSDLNHYDHAFRRMAILMTLPFLLLVGRLWQLQILESEQYAQKAFSNVVDYTPIPAERGLIFDSKGRLVAENRPAYNVTLMPILFAPHGLDPKIFDKRIELLKRDLSLTQEQTQRLVRKINHTKGLNRHKRLIVKKDITRDQVAIISTHSIELPGVEVQAVSQRHYPYDDLAVHVIGYMGEISETEYKRLKDHQYLLGDMIGRTGIERAFEPLLRGALGLHATVVNSRRVPQYDEASQRVLGDWQDIQPIPGKNIVLTIDMDLQRIIRDALAGYESGAVVALDPRTGRILAMASHPTFNPNSWSGRLSRDEVIETTADPYKPMIDKTLLSYFPGSIYKIVPALAGLELGLITPTETLHCPGYYAFGKNKKKFRCWKKSGHKNVNLVEAIEGSCDVYFYKLGEKIGMDKLAEYAKELGFGSKTGIGINTDSPGLVPTRAYHEKHSPEGWQAGYTLSTAIGQGDTRVTPLQMALAYAAIANGGTLYFPNIVDHIESPDGKRIFEYPVRVRRQLRVRRENLHEIVKGLDLVVNSKKGTSYVHRLSYVRVAGKTGTAQVISRQVSNSALPWHQRDHAWFVAFAPVSDPEIVLVVLLEHGGSGGKNAAPVAMEILDRYFQELRHYNPMLVQPDQPKPKFLEPPRRPGARDAQGRTLLGDHQIP